MDIKSLMSGIAVVIDDKLEKDENIRQITGKIEKEWEIPFYRTDKIPSDSTCNNLLQSASFVLLDWKLWPSEAEESGIENNIRFLEKAKSFFVPVFIFTNSSTLDVVDELVSNANLSEPLYHQDREERNFIFVKNKGELLKEDIFDPIMHWIQKNASVYTLKAWEQAFYESKGSLFSSMYKKSPDWPKVFWKSYETDKVDPSSSMTRLINDMLLGRIKTDLFKEEIFDSGEYSESAEDIRLLISEASFIKNLPENEIRSGDVFAPSEKKYLINIRPDCDCVPRQNKQTIDDVELYCIEGEKMSESQVRKSYKQGHFDERIWESISFSLHEGKTVRFDFRKLEKKKFSEIKEDRVGRLIHPYITRIQQRYGLYLQRQGLPRVPEEAISGRTEKSYQCEDSLLFF